MTKGDGDFSSFWPCNEGMCAIFEIKLNSETIEKILNKKISPPFLEFSSRVLPYQNSWVLIKNKEEDFDLELKEMSYSLVPSWSKNKKADFATHNARVETITEKATWKNSFITRRCVVPLTQFIEPIYENELAGNMVKFGKPDETLLFASGLWDTWIDNSGMAFDSFAIITRAPLKFVEQKGHDRSPLFLDEKSVQEWLDPNISDEKQLLSLLYSQQDNIELKAEIDRPLKGFNSSQMKLF